MRGERNSRPSAFFVIDVRSRTRPDRPLRPLERMFDHPRARRNEKQIDQQLLAFFATIRIEDAEARQWFVDVIKPKAHAGVDRNREHQKELGRQRERVNAELKMLLDLRIDGEIIAED